MVHGEICIFVIYLFCSYIRVIYMYYIFDIFRIYIYIYIYI